MNPRILRILIILILMIAILIILTSTRTYCIPSQSEENVKVEERVVEKKKPVSHELTVLSVEDMIIVECDQYGIDEELALAIAKLETGHFSSDAYITGNNVGGLSIDEEPMCFPTLERGVEAFVKNLYYNYYEQGLDTVDEIAKKYCPINEEQWAETVKALM